MPISNKISHLAVAIFAGAAGYLLHPDERGRIVALENQLASSKATISGLQQKSKSDSALTPQEATEEDDSSIPTSMTPPTPRVATPQQKELKSDESKGAMRTFFIQHRVSELEKYTELNESERQALKDKFSNSLDRQSKLPASERSAQALDEEHNGILREVLGAERADAIIKQEEDAEKREVEDALDQVSITFSRKLSLTTEQERSVRQILSEAHETLKPMQEVVQQKMQEVGLQHQSNNPETLKAVIDDMRSAQDELRNARRNMLQERFRNVLGSDQIQALTDEMQANPDSLFGLRGY